MGFRVRAGGEGEGWVSVCARTTGGGTGAHEGRPYGGREGEGRGGGDGFPRSCSRGGRGNGGGLGVEGGMVARGGGMGPRMREETERVGGFVFAVVESKGGFREGAGMGFFMGGW